MQSFRSRIFFAFISFFLSAYTTFADTPKTPELQEKLDSYLKRASDFGFSGSVLVAVDGKVILQKGYGLAERGRRVPVTEKTIFCTGSITKQFTAAAIMKLEAMGKLSTDDKLGKFIPVPADKADVTLHQLLTHTAGFPEYSGEDYAVSERDETIKRILAEPLSSKPGTVMNYSNSGYSVLAAVVEIAAGMPYELFLQNNLFRPAGMSQTGYVLPKFDKSSLPHGYNGEKDFGTQLDHAWSAAGPYWNLFGNGGILSTPADMYKWYTALQSDGVLPQAQRTKLFTPALSNYAYGWVVTKNDFGQVIGHGGASDFGFNARINWYPEKKVVVITMSNAGEYYGGTNYSTIVSARLAQLIFTNEPVSNSEVFRPTKSDPALAAKYSGTYRLTTGGRFIISKMGGSLTIEPEGQDAIDALILPKASQLSELTGRTNSIIGGVLKNDFDPLRENMATEDAADRYRQILQQRLKTWTSADGAFRELTVAGTAPAWWTDDASPATIVKLKFEKSTHYLRLHWRNGKINGLGGESIRSPVTMPLIPVESGGFAAWHLVLSKNISVQFDESKGAITGLTLNTEGKIVKAVKEMP